MTDDESKHFPTERVLNLEVREVASRFTLFQKGRKTAGMWIWNNMFTSASLNRIGTLFITQTSRGSKTSNNTTSTTLAPGLFLDPNFSQKAQCKHFVSTGSDRLFGVYSTEDSQILSCLGKKRKNN